MFKTYFTLLGDEEEDDKELNNEEGKEVDSL
jgi:hypothetical protein